MLSGIKDVDREILKHVNDRELLRVCSIDKKTWNEVCDDNFLRRRLAKYPEIEKYEKDDETWKQFFLRFVYYTSKMRDEYKFEYREGDFKNHYHLLKRYVKIQDLLHEASEKGELDIVKYAVQNGADIHKSSDFPFRIAARKGHFEVAKYLLSLGSDVNADHGEAIRYASLNGYLDFVKYLVEHGANIHAVEDQPLQWAAFNGYLDVVKYLAEHGANLRSGNDRALIWVIKNNHLDIVKYLIEHGSQHPNAIKKAIEYGRKEIEKYLLFKDV
jgi:hypothetical protein